MIEILVEMVHLLPNFRKLHSGDKSVVKPCPVLGADCHGFGLRLVTLTAKISQPAYTSDRQWSSITVVVSSVF